MPGFISLGFKPLMAVIACKWLHYCVRFHMIHHIRFFVRRMTAKLTFEKLFKSSGLPVETSGNCHLCALKVQDLTRVLFIISPGEGIFVSLFLIGRRIVHLYLIFFLLCSLKVKYTKYKCNFIVFFDALDFLFRHSRSNTPIANWLCIDGTQFSNSRQHLLIYLILDFWGGIE